MRFRWVVDFIVGHATFDEEETWKAISDSNRF